MKARVFITLKNGVLDPQGKAIGHALNGLGFASVGDVRQGKVIDLDLSETDAAKAKASLKDMCDKLLANTVIEKYEIELKQYFTVGGLEPPVQLWKRDGWPGRARSARCPAMVRF